MELIDKATVVAEIEKLSAYLDSLHEQRIIEKILSIIDTLELKEVDLEKEIEKVKKMQKNFEIKNDTIIEFCAKHFFELGLKVQKGSEK